MSEELDLGRLVAGIALDNSELMENAEEAQEAIRDIGTEANNTDTSVPPPNTQPVESAYDKITRTIQNQQSELSALMKEYQKSALEHGKDSTAV